jgi:PAS domain S-box-containing protein
MIPKIFKFEWKILTAFFITVSILIVLGTYSVRNGRQSVLTNAAVVQTNKVLSNIEQLLVANLNIELGQRGFELTGREEFLEPYTFGVAEVSLHMDSVRQLTRDNASQQKRLDTLDLLIKNRLQFSKDAITMTREWLVMEPQPDHSAFLRDFLPLRTRNKAVMDHIRHISAELRAEETVLLAERMRANETKVAEFNQAFVALLIFIVFVLVIVFITVQSSLQKLRVSEITEKNFRALLESSIESQKKVLIRSVDTGHRYLLFNSSFKASTLNGHGATLQLGMNLLNTTIDSEHNKSTVANFNRALAGESHLSIDESGTSERNIFETFYSPIFNEQRTITGATAFSSDVTERKHADDHLHQVTEKLRIANSELDAFCYSVSHDLRAPLRSINGYSKILLEDYIDKLDAEGQHSLKTVMNNARKMGQLIDDLLNFSQIGKTTLRSTILLMDQIVAETVTEQREEKKTNIVIEIGPLEPAKGDLGLIRQVWTNLISNAIKYSGKVDFPKIEIGSTVELDRVVYYVKDNGVGFDMIYAHKLFGVFQRLHKSADFEGTGVGLSIINRIITRHGGQAWAEGKVDHGATFYFSLPI